MANLFSSFSFLHPFYLSVTDLKYNPAEKSMEQAVKMFTNDLEDALNKLNGKKYDLINGTNKEELNKVLEEYINKRLKVKADGKDLQFVILGFEKEEEATWIYRECRNCAPPKKIAVENSLLYDYIPTQSNIVQAEMNGKKLSSKVTRPETVILLEF